MSEARMIYSMCIWCKVGEDDLNAKKNPGNACKSSYRGYVTLESMISLQGTYVVRIAVLVRMLQN